MSAAPVRGWREAEADAVAARADAIEEAIGGLESLEGMFDQREEIRDAVGNALRLLATEAGNLRRAAAAMRATPEEETR